MKTILVLALSMLAVATCAKNKTKAKAWLDKASAAKEVAGFELQGEYTVGKDGLQISLMPKDQFHVVRWAGGLPGAGWDGKKPDSKLVDMATAKAATDGAVRVERKSPTIGAKPPEGAVVLFGGPEQNLFKGEVEDGVLWAGSVSNEHYGSFKMHLEFRQPFKPGRMVSNQDRGNSGIYIFNRYEVQVLDSFTAPHAFGTELAFKPESDPKQWCASLYKFAYPSVNMCLPPLEWQTYDIDFTAPKFEGGKKVANARLTLRHNGVLVHDDLELPKGTGNGGKRKEVAKESIYLQNHGNPVAYRNIWLVPVND